MDPESSSSRLRSVAKLCADYDQRQKYRAARRQSMCNRVTNVVLVGNAVGKTQADVKGLRLHRKDMLSC